MKWVFVILWQIALNRDARLLQIYIGLFIRFTPILVSYSFDVIPNFTNIAAGTS